MDGTGLSLLPWIPSVVVVDAFSLSVRTNNSIQKPWMVGRKDNQAITTTPAGGVVPSYTSSWLKSSLNLNNNNNNNDIMKDNNNKEEDKILVDDDDDYYMKMALDYASMGYGHSYPNPAVGCVLVDTDSKNIIGSGFHPKAGLFHAEAFALLEACGHVSSGIDAASRCCDLNTDTTTTTTPTPSDIQSLLDIYSKGNDGPSQLFLSSQYNNNNNNNDLLPKKVTAYVTLEPCCHVGKRTPPCAQTFVLLSSKEQQQQPQQHDKPLFVIERVVIGQVDPNPQVDGGGVQILKDGGIDVRVLPKTNPVAKQCYALIDNFNKRTTTTTNNNNSSHSIPSIIGGPQKSILRSLAGQWKQEGTMTQIEWGGNAVTSMDDELSSLYISPSWLEQVDTALWKHELIVLRLNKACKKKKQAKALGEQIAKKLTSGTNIVTLVQTVGHTVLLYRPTLPKPIIQLYES